MEITIKYSTLCQIIWENLSNLSTRVEKIEKLISTIYNNYCLRFNPEDENKIENFYTTYERKIKESHCSKSKFMTANQDWMKKELTIEIAHKQLGRPKKDYDDVQTRTKKIRQTEIIETFTQNEIKDSFKSVLTRTQPKDAAKIVEVLPTASPKRLKRMVKSIPTPKSEKSFTEEEALALILNLGLSRNKYSILKKALKQKGYDILPSNTSISEKKSHFAITCDSGLQKCQYCIVRFTCKYSF